MNELQREIAIQNTFMQLVDSFMRQNDVSALEMDHAISKVMLNLKDIIMNSVLMECEKEKSELLANTENEMENVTVNE